MRKFLTILTIIAVMFTFSFGSAFAGTFASASVGQVVNSAINGVDVTKYLVKDEAFINTAKAALIDATEDETEYNSDVIAAINTFNNAIADIKTIADQKTELVKDKTDANTLIDNAILSLTTKLTDELTAAKTDEATQRLSTLTSDMATYKTYLKDKITKIEIVDNRTTFDKSEVDITAARAEIADVLDKIATDATTFYACRDLLNNRATLNLCADNYAKKMALIFESDQVTRVYSDKAIADVLAEVKDKIKVLEITEADKVEAYMLKEAVSADAEEATSLTEYKTAAIASITTGSYTLTNYSDLAKTEVAKIHTTYTAYINAANSKALVDAYVVQAKAAMNAYRSDAQVAEDNDKLTNLDKENKELADKLAKLEQDSKIVNIVAAQTDTLACRSAKTSKGNIKITVKGFDDSEIVAAGYTVKYTYYRATAKTGSYVKKLTKTEQTYTNTTGTKGVKYWYKVKVSVYDKDGNLITMTKLSDCKKAIRTK